MGVPAFFRWLSRKYPSVIVNCIEEKEDQLDGTTVPVDSSKPNPNGIEFDNLYLDMNGIIHPCTHPEDKPAPKNEDEMMIAIFECIDRLFRIVRPRKLLYMAIDGVAPRAKMNQQRSRRFRASKETVEKVDEVARIRAEMITKGYVVPPEKEKGSHFDSNCITPGTPFMARLSSCLHYYIHDRLNTDPGWRNIKIILSDANVPGEGEHKIMDYIRKQRAQPDHDPNTQHCLCGADADLIMLGLATHEPNFTIIREEFKPNQPRPCDICGQLGHEMKECTGLAMTETVDGSPSFSAEQQFIFVRLNVLREYLERELQMPGIPFKYDFERAIDDWVFMCFFVGNDFLPHLPSLEIREGAIDRLVGLYKKTVHKTGGFITDSGDVNLDRVQLIMADLGEMEDEIFKKRQQTELMFKQRNKMKKRREKQMNRPAFLPQGQFAPTPIGQSVQPLQNVRQEAYYQRVQNMHQHSQGGRDGEGGGGRGRDGEGGGGRGWRGGRGGRGRGGNSYQDNRGQKRPMEDDSSSEEEVNDEVRLWEDGFKSRYYESKFDISAENHEFRHRVALEYVRGLSWVLRYYYQGCASWNWYFPYHYAPFASDFQNIGGLSTSFERGTEPFKPLEQLMSVFPAASSGHVPAPWAPLMSDHDSPIIDFYPEDFKIDLNGKKFAWQGVALLPFVDEKRLHKALEPYYGELTDAEKRRNVRGDDRLYIGRDHTSYSFFTELYSNPNNFTIESEISAEGMRGSIVLAEDCVKQGGSLPSPVDGLEVIRNNTVLCVRFRDPKYGESFIFAAKRLTGAVEPPKVLKPGNLDEAQSKSWRPQIGMTRGNQRGYLGNSGHRMLDHSIRREPGVYSSVPPLMYSYDNASNRGGSHSGGNRGGRSSYLSSGGPTRESRDNRGGGYRYQPYQQHGSSNVGGPRPPGYVSQSQSQSSYNQSRNSYNDSYSSNQRSGYNTSNQRDASNNGNQNRQGNQRRDAYPRPSINQGGRGYWQSGSGSRR